MRFGPVRLSEAAGAVLAHSVALPGGRLRKGRVLGPDEIAALGAAGVEEVTVARLEPGEVAEDAAAERLGAALEAGGEGLLADAPFTGRVNLRSPGPGILRVDAGAVARINAVDPAITLATLPDRQRVAAGTLVATVKIIPYAAPGPALRAACEAAPGALRHRPPVLGTAALVVTRIAGQGGSDDKAVEATRARLAALGVDLAEVRGVDHATAPLARALADLSADLLLVLTASATSDRADVGPAAVVAAGGRIERFGMPVDPGNLLFLGYLGARPVIGLPGCARSPALNGADWVMERVICGEPPDGAEIAAMGVGGLLKEIPARGQPRERGPRG